MNEMMTAPGIQDKPKRHINKRLLTSSAVFGIIFAAIFVKQGLGLNLTLFFLLIYVYAAVNAKSIFAKTPCVRSSASTRLTLSKNSVQSTAEISSMLVIALRTVTLMAAWR